MPIQNLGRTPTASLYFDVPPFFKNTDVPYPIVRGSFFDVRFEMSFPVLGWHQNNTERIFEFDGESLGTPTVYLWASDTENDFDVPVPESLDGTHWVKLAIPPLNLQGDWVDNDGYWQGDWGKVFMMRFKTDTYMGGPWIARSRTGADTELSMAILDDDEPQFFAVNAKPK